MAGTVILTEKRIDELMEFKDSSDEFWLGLGRTSEWDDESSPPDPKGDETEVEELFGLVKSKVSIDLIEASVTVGDSSEGQIDIYADDEGSDANSYVAIVENPEEDDSSLDASWDDSNEELTISLATDGNGDLDDDVNTAENVSDEVSTLVDFSSDVNTEGVFSQDSVDESPYEFSGGEGPEEDSVCCIEDEDGEVNYRGNSYKKIYNKDVYDEEATYLYFEILVPVDEFESIDSYRQVGLFRDTVIDTDNTDSDDEVLDYPDEVSDEGELYAIGNIRRVERRDDRYETLGFMIEF